MREQRKCCITKCALDAKKKQTGKSKATEHT